MTGGVGGFLMLSGTDTREVCVCPILSGLPAEQANVVKVAYQSHICPQYFAMDSFVVPVVHT